MKASDFFKIPASLEPFAAHFPADLPPWEWLKRIGEALASWHFEPTRPVPAGVHVTGSVYLHPSVKLPPYAIITGPAWIGPETDIRPGAQIRGNVIAGARCVLGNASEYKNCLLLDEVETAHYNYVGDSVLGSKAHLGAGAICSNLRLDRQNVVVRGPEANYETGLRKFGAIIGDGAEVGCNAVLNPGTTLGPRSLVMPTLAFGGCLPADSIAKGRQTISLIKRRS
jgi:UDP-N-acetylglucosamine diphosphorylase / glucose-1-phosphate thymidylyltransferase / UDP-N-acetylgalactosamine diphosphorylase / glucosamine-1-phosphate N-acetyltransferase / galactosamine-1-phosphate N-acetyltransferase